MKFSEIIAPEQIILELKASDRWQTIEELVECLTQRGLIEASRKATVVQAVNQREKTMSTGIGFGIAIPHASTDSISKVTAVLGRSTKGIQFESLDNQPVKLVVLFLVPAGQYQQHLKTLASISRFLNDRNFREEVEKAASAQDIYQLILKRES